MTRQTNLVFLTSIALQLACSGADPDKGSTGVGGVMFSASGTTGFGGATSTAPLSTGGNISMGGSTSSGGSTSLGGTSTNGSVTANGGSTAQAGQGSIGGTIAQGGAGGVVTNGGTVSYGGAATGGLATAGASNGGAVTGGTSKGGAANGGASNGGLGAMSPGGATSSGGISTGGTATTGCSSASGKRYMENLGRGVVATRASANSVFVSWRLLGCESWDVGFNVYRSTNGAAAVKLNGSVLTSGTNFTDVSANLAASNAYHVRPVMGGTEQAASAIFALAANTPIQPFYAIPIRNTPGYAAKFIWVGDLDGDGEYDFVFDKQPTDATQVILLEAYKRDGTLLWQLDCGPNSVNKYNIEPGSSTLDIGHGDNFTVYDINNDGKSEVIVRTANGVKFPGGATLTEADDNRQFISVLDGMTGKELSRAPVPTDYLSDGPLNGHMGIAYLDGVNPSVVLEAKNRIGSGDFNEIITTWSWNGAGLVQTWKWLRPKSGTPYPDGHQIRIIDVDGDGKDEISPMGFMVDHDGNPMWSLGTQGAVHGDRFSIGDLDPARPGLEGYAIQQDNPDGLAWIYYDAKTGVIINKQNGPANVDYARGCALDLDPRYKGYEFFTFTDGLYNVFGERITTSLLDSYPNLRFWWDGDLLSEMLDNGKIVKWDYLGNTEGRLYTMRDVIQIGPKTPGFYGDIIGDWREEAVYEAADHNSLVVYTTPIPSDKRIYTLPHNPAYRNSMTVKGYYQSNMLDYYLGDGMATPPRPDIRLAGGS